MMEGASSPLPPVIGIEDFAFRLAQPEHESPSQHSSNPTFSSPPAPPLHHQDYNISSNSYDESSSPTTDQENDDFTTEEEEEEEETGGNLLPDFGGDPSARSSISSLPGSVVHPTLPTSAVHTPTKRAHSPHILHHSRHGSLSYKIKSPQRDREYGSGFRNPSSVRAMQMRDEAFDNDPEITPSRGSRGSRGLSLFSHRSSNSTSTSPTKRGRPTPGSASNHSSPRKSKLKKEFPLVLLHCSLLPPALGLPVAAASCSDAVMREVLPEEYWRRWKVLQDKVNKNTEVRLRGVLIPHPKDDYEMLEERLLESLELERPRIRANHFLGNQNAGFDSGIGSESATEEEESEVEGHDRVRPNGAKCTDCGKKVPWDAEVERKWEVKVYAANGLMRAGAWGAAWGEMEKVDVEVGVWMPEGVRREVEAQLAEMGIDALTADTERGYEGEEGTVANHTDEESEEERRRREIYGEDGGRTQDKINGLFDEESILRSHEPHSDREAHDRHMHAAHGPDFQTLVLNYVQGLFVDRKNVAIAFLSVLVLFYAMSAAQPLSPPIPTSKGSATTAAMAVPEVITTTLRVTETLPPSGSVVEITSISTMTTTAISISTLTDESQVSTSSAVEQVAKVVREADEVQVTSAEIAEPRATVEEGKEEERGERLLDQVVQMQADEDNIAI